LNIGANTYGCGLSSVTGITSGLYNFCFSPNNIPVNKENFNNGKYIPINYVAGMSSGSYSYPILASSTVSYIGVRTVSASQNLNFILSDLMVEVISNGSSTISSGTQCYKFCNSTMSDFFMYNAMNSIYNQFYQKPVTTIVPTGY